DRFSAMFMRRPSSLTTRLPAIIGPVDRTAPLPEFRATTGGALRVDLPGFRINHHAVLVARGGHRYFPIDHVPQHVRGRAFERITVACSPSGPTMDPIAGVQIEDTF